MAHEKRWKIVPGNTEAALEWVHRLIANGKKAGLTPSLGGSILWPITGETDWIGAAGRFASMAEYEETLGKRRADSGFMALVKELNEADWYLGVERQIYDAKIFE